MRLTNWYPADILPARRGLYEIRFAEWPELPSEMQFFDGDGFTYSSGLRSGFGMVPGDRWRGSALPPPGAVWDMNLCESTKVVLRIGQAYRFTPDPECKSCQKMKRAHDKAYGLAGTE